MTKPRTPPPPPSLNPHLASLLPYPPGRPIEEVQREFNLTDVVKLASNENPLGPSPKALKAIVRVAAEMNLYPDGAGFYLKQALAAKLGVAPGNIVLGNGSDEITGFLAQAYLGPRHGLVTSNYAFVRYKMAADVVAAPTTLVPMRDMRHDAAGIAAAIMPSTALVALDVPCNPTGAPLSVGEIETILKRLPAGALLLLDQAYYEYAAADPGYPDGIALFKRHPNIVVTRTFSKAYGLAGLRIGYAAARAEVVADIDRVRPPFNANRMAQAAALAALADDAHIRRSVAANARGKAQLQAGFDKLQLGHWPTAANFILVDLARDARPVFIELQRRGVIARPMAGYGLTTCLRISIGTAAENKKCLAALRAVL